MEEEHHLPRELLIETDDELEKSYSPSPTVVTQVIENTPCLNLSVTFQPPRHMQAYIMHNIQRELQFFDFSYVRWECIICMSALA